MEDRSRAPQREDYSRIPQSTMESLQHYVNQGVPAGHFLTAVLSNDLFQAMSRADAANAAALPDLVTYIYNCVPRACWGSPKAYGVWIELGGMEQYEKAADDGSRQCTCADPECAIKHPAGETCTNQATGVLVRIDDADEETLPFCSTCMEDAMESGAYR